MMCVCVTEYIPLCVCVCSKGDFDGAITQYILTIGKLEPSYVIRKVSSVVVIVGAGEWQPHGILWANC